MNYLKTKRMKLLVSIIVLFMLFQIYKFFKIRITNMDLPKGKIVFSSNKDGDNEIYTMNINGSSLKQLTHNSATKTSTATDNETSFSRDGKSIVFKSSRAEKQNYRIITNDRGRPIGEEFSGGSTDIYIMDSDGNNQIPLTYNTLSSDPFFSPDAEKIIFNTLLIDNQRRNLVKMINIDGSGEKTLSFVGGQVKFSTDGNRIFDNFESDVSVADIDGANRKRLTHLNDDKEPKLEIDFVVSPDDKKLAIITRKTRKHYRTDNIDDYYAILEFYTINVDGSDLKKIYRIDGSNLEELYKRDEQVTSGGFIIREYERLPDGSLREKVYRDSVLKGGSVNIWDFKYSLDYKYIVFVVDFSFKTGIFLLNLKDRTVINLTKKKENWKEIRRFTFTPDGKRIVFVADIFPENYYLHAVILRNIKAYINYFIFRKQTPYYDNKYICIMDMNGENYRRIVKLPVGSELGRDFIHWDGGNKGRF